MGWILVLGWCWAVRRQHTVAVAGTYLALTVPSCCPGRIQSPASNFSFPSFHETPGVSGWTYTDTRAAIFSLKLLSKMIPRCLQLPLFSLQLAMTRAYAFCLRDHILPLHFNQECSTSYTLLLVKCSLARVSALRCCASDSIIESSRLEKAFKVTEPDHQPDLLSPITKLFPLGKW